MQTLSAKFHKLIAQFVQTLSAQLVPEWGKGFGKRALLQRKLHEALVHARERIAGQQLRVED